MDGSVLANWLRLIIAIFLFWVLAFGVTVNGNHYGMSFSCEEGVKVQIK